MLLWVIYMLLSSWLENWLSLRAGSLAPRTLECYRSTIRLHIVPVLGAVDLPDLKPEQLAELLGMISAGGHTRTAQLTHAILHKAFADAVRHRLLSSSPMADVPRPAHRAQRAQWLDPSILAAYLAAVDRDPHRLAWLLALYCGLRRGEIAGLRWCDVDMRAQVLHICNQRQRLESGEIVDLPPKSFAGNRPIPIPPQLLDELRAARRIGGYVVQYCGHPITPAALDRAHARMLARAGLPHCRLHDIRHTMGAVAVRSGVPIKVLQVLLGHAHYSTTADIYAHVDAAAARDAIARIAAAMI